MSPMKFYARATESTVSGEPYPMVGYWISLRSFPGSCEHTTRKVRSWSWHYGAVAAALTVALSWTKTTAPPATSAETRSVVNAKPYVAVAMTLAVRAVLAHVQRAKRAFVGVV